MLDLTPLLAPETLHAWADLERDRIRPPARPGTYAWYFEAAAVPRSVPIAHAHRFRDDWVLLYVGIAPQRPAAGKPPSRKTLRSRLRYHFRGNARGSTLRLSLGSLLAEVLGLQAVRADKGLTFGATEQTLSGWLAAHGRVCWLEHPQPWDLEHHALATLDLPLNIRDNPRNPFRAELSAVRRDTRRRAIRVAASTAAAVAHAVELDQTCPFCAPDAASVFYEDELVRGLWDTYPVAPGHALIVPRRHAEDWFSATHQERVALMRATDAARAAVLARYAADGFNIGINAGTAAGQTVSHLHVHVIPRVHGDSPDPRGGIRWVLPAHADYWSNRRGR